MVYLLTEVDKKNKEYLFYSWIGSVIFHSFSIHWSDLYHTGLKNSERSIDVSGVDIYTRTRLVY